MSLGALRKKIDAIDREIIALLAKRKRTVLEIAKIKKETGLRVVDKAREKKVFRERRALARKNSLSPGFAEKIFRLIVDDSCSMQEKAIGPRNEKD